MKIKRFVTLMIVAAVGMTMMFAANQAGSNTTDSDGRKAANVTASATVGLDLTSVDLNSYTFGFSSDSSTLTPVTAISLKMGADYKAHIDTNKNAAIYILWDARSTDNFKLSIATPEPLTKDSDTIDYTITFASGDNAKTSLTTSTENETWSTTVNGNANELIKGSVKIESIETVVIPASQAKGSYKSNLILKIENAG